MFIYTLGFIKKGNEVLLINRYHKPWMGSWNGLGGKIKPHETPKEAIQREIKEEANIILKHHQIQDKGFLTWNSFDANGQGLWLFLIELDPEEDVQITLKTEEGLLEWKSIDWILNPANTGIAENIPFFLPDLLYDQKSYHFHCIFDQKHLKHVERKPIK